MIVTLCGSLKFEEAFKKWNERLTFAGHTVFTVSVYPSDKGTDVKEWYTDEQKVALDAAHKRKIAASDAIVVITDTGGYIGDSTNSEIAYARQHDKLVYFTHFQNHWPGYSNLCPYAGCHDPLTQRPPCALCYE